MRTSAPPYRLPTTAPVAGPWLSTTGDGVVRLDDVLPDWDYATTLRLARDVEVDAGVIADEVRLPPSAELGLVAIWRASVSQLRGSGRIQPVVAGSPGSVTINLELPGQDLGGTLEIETCLVLLSEVVDAAGLTPRHPGSVLWSDKVKVRLQGDAPLFPISVIDLAEAGFDPGAPWALQVPDDLDVPAMGALLLLVNSKRPHVVKAVEAAGKPSADQKAIMSVLGADVGRTLIEWALSIPEFDLDHEYDDESIGKVVVALTARCFPGRQLGDIRTLQKQEPAYWAASLNGQLGALREDPSK